MVPGYRVAVRGPAVVPGTRYVLWVLLSLPAAFQSYRYWDGELFYGEFLHWSGVFASQLLLVTLAIGPLRLLFPRVKLSRWLLVRRRYFGVATFAYAAIHTMAYLVRNRDRTQTVFDEALGPEIGTGWIALAIFAALAATSNDRSVRRLGKRWKLLHKTVYVGALLVFLHWILTAFDPRQGVIYLAVFVGLFFIGRLARVRKT